MTSSWCKQCASDNKAWAHKHDTSDGYRPCHMAHTHTPTAPQQRRLQESSSYVRKQLSIITCQSSPRTSSTMLTRRHTLIRVIFLKLLDIHHVPPWASPLRRHIYCCSNHAVRSDAAGARGVGAHAGARGAGAARGARGRARRLVCKTRNQC